MKQCRTCCETKPLAMYSKKPDSRDGLQPVCKHCAASYRKQWATNKPGYVQAYNAKYLKANSAALSAYSKARRTSEREHIHRLDRAAYARNAEANRARRAAYYKQHREQCLDTIRAWRQTHGKAWRKNHYALYGHKYAAQAAKRRAQERQATPMWADYRAIEAFYETAAGLSMHTGEWYHVDHIVPLRGKTVCGLHVQSNLEVLTAQENLLKSNRHWPDQPQ